jgi:transposase
MRITCGIDWAEAHHDVALLDGHGALLAKKRIDPGFRGFSELLAVIADLGGVPGDVPVAIETDKNLIVVALQAAGFVVHAVNPRAVARYRERHAQAGGKSDPGDAIVLANILRTDAHLHRPLPEITELGLAVKALARQHQEAVWARQVSVNRLRSVLVEFFPQALAAFPVLTHKAALAVLRAAPTPAQGVKLSRGRVVALLRRSGRGDRDGLADTVVAHFRAPALRQPPQVEAGLGHAVVGLVGVIEANQTAVAGLEVAMGAAFDRHPSAGVLRAVPGLGPVLAARVLAEIGDDPARFKTASGRRAFAGTAPITKASGRSKTVRNRIVKNKRLANACHWWAFAALTKSPGARAHYDRRKTAGDSHNAALRNLANKLLGRLWWCLANNVAWDETTAWPTPTDTSRQRVA